jgi:arylsulfatase A-like enzyme
VRYIRDHREQPFFLYLAYNAPHLPVYASEAFQGRSPRGRYGDVVEEIDWSVGQVLQALRELGLDRNTLVVFTSDNGPWASFGLGSGSAGMLRGAKASIWEGGVRVPAIAWWPGTIAPARVTTALAALQDLFPTAMELAGGAMPRDREIDGVSLAPVLRGEREQVRELAYYYVGPHVGAVRKGPWKLYVAPPGEPQPAAPAAAAPQAAGAQGGGGQGGAAQAAAARPGIYLEPTWQTMTAPRPGTLYNLDEDPSEQFDAATTHPEIVADLLREAERHRATIRRVPSLMSLPRVPTTLEEGRSSR